MQQKNITCLTVGDIATNCWIYPLDAVPGCAIIDPGAEPDRIIARLDELKLVPQYILITHGHFDHIAALPALAAAYRGKINGKNPVIGIHRLDAEYLGPASYNVHCRSFAAAAGNTAYIDALWEDMPDPDLLFEEGVQTGPFTVLHLPGHSPGSAAFWDKDANLLFSGDTLFQGDYGRTDLPGGSREQIFGSLKRLLAMDGGIRILPGHGPVTSIAGEQGLI